MKFWAICFRQLSRFRYIVRAYTHTDFSATSPLSPTDLPIELILFATLHRFFEFALEARKVKF